MAMAMTARGRRRGGRRHRRAADHQDSKCHPPQHAILHGRSPAAMEDRLAAISIPYHRRNTASSRRKSSWAPFLNE
jgi:hypothetical protein